MTEPLTTDEVVAVKTYLYDGDLIAVSSGNMAGLYRVHNDAVKGEASLVFEGIASITGGHNLLRRVKP